MAIIIFASYKIIDILKNKTKQTETFGDHDWATLRTDSQLLVGYFLRRQLGFKRQRCSAVGDTLCFVPPRTRNQQLHFTRVFTERAGWDLLLPLGQQHRTGLMKCNTRSLDLPLQVISDLEHARRHGTQKSSYSWVSYVVTTREKISPRWEDQNGHRYRNPAAVCPHIGRVTITGYTRVRTVANKLLHTIRFTHKR